MDITQKKIWVKGLLVDCPYNAPLEDCALNDLRNEPMKTRLMKVNAMTHKQLDGIISHHKQCLTIREGTQAVSSS
jgi:hypothetical protein